MIFDDFGAVFRFHWVYGMLSWTIDSLQRFVELLCVIGVVSGAYYTSKRPRKR